YSLTVENGDAVLVFSYVGFDTQEVSVGTQSEINISMVESIDTMNEVVVTALGIEREQRSLGYDVANVSGEDLTQVSQENLLSSLSGRVAGVAINQTNGPGSSSSVSNRGATARPTNNQPLFVVDGVHMTNSLHNIQERGDGNEVEYGAAISDIKPEDIASISV